LSIRGLWRGWWLVLASWSFLGPHGYSALAFTIVTGLAAMAIILPLSLSHLRRSAHLDEVASRPFRSWLAGDFEIWQGRLPAKSALIDILTVPAAAALGMTALAIVFQFVHSATGAQARLQCKGRL
jgi:hypothetical protein